MTHLLRSAPPDRPARPARAGVPDHGERASVYLHGGQVTVASEPTAITTVLGSCVAVCLYDPVARLGGMNHFLLPHHVERERSPRFGTVAVPALVDSLLQAGARRPGLKAKVFGGAAMWQATEGLLAVGARNIELADAALQELAIPVIGKDVGGVQSRKIIYNTGDGSVLLRRHSTLAGGQRPGET